jgi:hypothetical protein
MSLFFGNCQGSFTPELSVSQQDVTINPAGGSVQVIVSCNESWFLSISQSGVWFTTDPDGGSAGSTTLTITGESNTDVESRSATITISSTSGLSVTIDVYQNPEV